MLIIENQIVYRIDGEEAEARMIENKDIVELISDHTQSLMQDIIQDADGDTLIMGEYHADTVIRRLRREDPILRENFFILYQRMFDKFKTFVAEAGEKLSDYEIDMKPEDVPHNIHNEFGLAYDMDNKVLVDCADCAEKAMVAEEFLNTVAQFQKSVNQGREVRPDDIDVLLDKMPDIAEGYPSMIVALHIGDNVVLIGPKDTTPEFDDDLPMPTHVAKRILN